MNENDNRLGRGRKHNTFCKLSTFTREQNALPALEPNRIFFHVSTSFRSVVVSGLSEQYACCMLVQLASWRSDRPQAIKMAAKPKGGGRCPAGASVAACRPFALLPCPGGLLRVWPSCLVPTQQPRSRVALHRAHRQRRQADPPPPPTVLPECLPARPRPPRHAGSAGSAPCWRARLPRSAGR